MMVKFLESVLWNYEDSLRATGRTTRLVQRAKETSAVIVCHNYAWAHQLKKQYGIEAISLDTYLNSDYHRGRKKVNYLFDSPAEVELIKMKFREVERLLSGKVLDYET
jgi:hypothetical protein